MLVQAFMWLAKQNSLSEGIALAQQLIDNGKAKAQLEAFIKHSNE